MTTTEQKITVLRKGSSLRLILLNGVQIGQVVANWRERRVEVTVNDYFFTYGQIGVIQEVSWITSCTKNILGIRDW